MSAGVFWCGEKTASGGSVVGLTSSSSHAGAKHILEWDTEAQICPCVYACVFSAVEEKIQVALHNICLSPHSTCKNLWIVLLEVCMFYYLLKNNQKRF